MKTHELIDLPEAQLVLQLRQMKVKELERHAGKILLKLGAEYPPVLAAITRAIPELNKVEGDIFTRFQDVVRQKVAYTDSTEAAELIKRVSVILMLIVQRQFQKIHAGR